MLTINQALDQVYSKYKGTEAPADIQALKQHLIELKMVWGGNTQVENEKEVRNTIKYGTSDINKWK